MRVRLVRAHLRNPAVDGESLCGEVTRIETCEACASIRDSLLLVHVESPRRPGNSFCGKLLHVGGRGGSGGPRVPPLYVLVERARDLIADGGLPFCAGCEGNLERFDRAARRRGPDNPAASLARSSKKLATGDRPASPFGSTAVQGSPAGDRASRDSSRGSVVLRSDSKFSVLRDQMASVAKAVAAGRSSSRTAP